MPGARTTASAATGAVTAGSTSSLPRTASSNSGASPPGRSSRGTGPVMSTIVDSTPTWHGPSSTTASIFPSRSWSTCSAVVVLGLPDRLADGAATGTPARRMISRVTAVRGQRTATVSSPAVVRRGTVSRHGSTMVSGPGQNRRASSHAAPGMSRQMSVSRAGSAMWRISGLSWGRPLASKIRATAASSSPLAPRP